MDTASISSPGISRKKARKFNGNLYTDCSVSHTSTLSEKFKNMDDGHIPMIREYGYCFLNFFTVFSMLSNNLVCKECHGDVKFYNTTPRGLGFKITVHCPCRTKIINSCPLIDEAFEINRRIVFAMRMLGVGRKGLNLFCGIMDLGSSISNIMYYGCLHNIYVATKAVYDKVIARATEEEKENNVEHDKPSELAVLESWTLQKRGFSSLFGVATIIGKYSKKVLDAEINSSFCQDCNLWKNKLNTKEFCNWIERHRQNCINNKTAKSDELKLDTVKELFQRSEKKHGVKYTTYIGNVTSQIYKILNMKPYGDETIVTTTCIDHVQTILREQLQDIIDNENVLHDLTQYFGLAIRRNPDSIQDMKNEIWAAYYHAISSDKKSLHQRCPSGPDSWCDWRRAENEGTLDKYKHRKLRLSKDVLTLIKQVYENFTKDELLERYLAENTQNNDEYLKSLIGKLSPKHLHSSKACVEMATHLAVCIFNEGYNPILRILWTMGIFVGQGTLAFVNEMDDNRMDVSRMDRNAQYDFYEYEEAITYGLDIAD